MRTFTGTILENSLTQVRYQRGDKESNVASGEVLRVVWGTVPPAYRDGKTFLSRREYENAVAQFQLAASDGEVREVLQAASRLESISALIAWGATDETRFSEAVAEADRFLGDFPSNRDVPQAEALKARALLLAGQAAESGAAYEALFQKGASEPVTEGYSHARCLEAALNGAHAYLEAGDTLKARELFTAAESGLINHAATLTDASAQAVAHIQNLRGSASVGEGFCLLAGGDANRALSTFQRSANKRGAASGERLAAQLGLGLASLEAGKLRDAQLAFATVSALEHTNRDRIARALVGLGDATSQLGDANAGASSKRYWNQVLESYGDTPAARLARERLK